MFLSVASGMALSLFRNIQIGFEYFLLITGHGRRGEKKIEFKKISFHFIQNDVLITGLVISPKKKF